VINTLKLNLHRKVGPILHRLDRLGQLRDRRHMLRRMTRMSDTMEVTPDENKAPPVRSGEALAGAKVHPSIPAVQRQRQFAVFSNHRRIVRSGVWSDPGGLSAFGP